MRLKKSVEKQCGGGGGSCRKRRKTKINEAGGRQPKLFVSFSFPLSFSPSHSQSSFWASGPFTSCLICIMNDSEKANKVIGLWDVRLWPHVEKGPTAVSTGRGTVALYSILSEGYRAFFFREHTIYLRAGRKGADLQRVTGGEGWGWGCFLDSFQAKWTLIILACSHYQRTVHGPNGKGFIY